MGLMKRKAVLLIGIIGLLSFHVSARAEEFDQNLYARSAVLLDGTSGRVLYEKDGYVPMPMASTTKVMTCILALENCKEDEIVEVSARAAAQPDVQLNMIEGERYYLKDLLYSLMLKSHNDSAVAIAEHIAGSVEKFADLMNKKAAQLGCDQTYFITPNGLDAEDEGGVHSTTARDLATIMAYAIKNDRFLSIVQTPDYSFTDLDEKRVFVLHNANALLGTMEGLLGGKTGFTGNAGYCYVCAVRRDNRTFVIALLACGWPNNKNYKWEDTEKLVDYAFEQYHYKSLNQIDSLGAIEVENGIPVSDKLYEKAYANLEILGQKNQDLKFLLRDDEEIVCKVNLESRLWAPVNVGDVVGNVVYTLNGEVLHSYPIVLKNEIRKRHFFWYLGKLCEILLPS